MTQKKLGLTKKLFDWHKRHTKLELSQKTLGMTQKKLGLSKKTLGLLHKTFELTQKTLELTHKTLGLTQNTPYHTNIMVNWKSVSGHLKGELLK